MGPGQPNAKKIFLCYAIHGVVSGTCFAIPIKDWGELANRALVYWHPPPPLTGAEISIKLFFKDFCKNFRLYILINLKRKGKYLKLMQLNIIVSFCRPGCGKKKKGGAIKIY